MKDRDLIVKGHNHGFCPKKVKVICKGQKIKNNIEHNCIKHELDKIETSYSCLANWKYQCKTNLLDQSFSEGQRC